MEVVVGDGVSDERGDYIPILYVVEGGGPDDNVEGAIPELVFMINCLGLVYLMC